jgi:hypothetical protein
MQIRYQDDDPCKRIHGSLITLKKILFLQRLRLQNSPGGSDLGLVRVPTRVRWFLVDFVNLQSLVFDSCNFYLASTWQKYQGRYNVESA